MNVIDTLDVTDIKRRWPRLLRSVRWAGFLTEEQALVALYAYKGCGLEHSSCEAVSSIGGNLLAIRMGIRGRRGAAEAARNGERTRIREAVLEAFWGVVAQGYPDLHVSGLPADAAIELVLAADSAIDFCLGDRSDRSSASVQQ